MKLIDTLATVAWGQYFFGSCVCWGALKRRDIRVAQGKGLVESVGLVEVCDGDGFVLEPTRYLVGFRLTKAGEYALRRGDPEAAEVYLGTKVDKRKK